GDWVEPRRGASILATGGLSGGRASSVGAESAVASGAGSVRAAVCPVRCRFIWRRGIAPRATQPTPRMTQIRELPALFWVLPILITLVRYGAIRSLLALSPG